jgi:membrane protein DedA with SNARE-associated domain
VSPQLPGIFGTLAPVLNSYGYLAVAGFIVLEDFGVPVPGETILIAAAVYAGAHQLNIVGVAVVGFLAAVAGDNIGFAIGHYGGHQLAVRYGRYVFLTEPRLIKAEDFFRRHGGKVVVVARFVEGLRQANGIIAGTVQMPWRRFLAFNALGAALWVSVWASVGYLAGNNIDTVYRALTRYLLYILAAVALAIAARIGWHLYTRRQRRAPTV